MGNSGYLIGGLIKSLSVIYGPAGFARRRSGTGGVRFTVAIERGWCISAVDKILYIYWVYFIFRVLV